jgi:UDP-glucose 4-epimerase
MKEMRILITGGAGCLGSNLVEKFFSQGHQVCVIDNFATGKREVLSERKGLRIIEGSIAHPKLIEKTFTEFQPTHVIHSAASYKDPSNWSEDAITNVCGSIIVARESEKLGVKRLINFQTALCYGNPQAVPIPVSAPTAPITSYGISKTAGEAYLLQGSIPVVSLRLANICGPRLAIGPIPTFYKRLKEGQNCFCTDTVRDFLDIRDFFQLIDLVMLEGAPTGVFNVSTGVGHTILDIYKEVCLYLGMEPPKVDVKKHAHDDIHKVVLDPSNTARAFGWSAKVGFKETIQNQLLWYDAHGVNDIFSHLAESIKQATS